MSLYNLRNPAVKRLMKEAEELLHPTEEYHAQPVEDNLFEWHFTLRGPPNTDYEGGIYHGRITLPPDYPMKPPSIILLTPNGRFETNKKICLSISGHHPESWQPSWSIRTALLAIIGFMPTHGNGALGSLDYTPEERQQLALKSRDWKCIECGYIKDIFVKKKPLDCLEDKNSSSSSEIPSDSEENSFLSDNKCPHNSLWWSAALTIKRKKVRALRKKYQRIYHNEELRTFWRLKFKKAAAEYNKAILEAKAAPKEPSRVLLSGDHASSSVYSENSAAILPPSDDGTSLVHRQKSHQASDVKPKQTTTTPRPMRNNSLYTIFVFVIVFMLAFLCLRRLLSM